MLSGRSQDWPLSREEKKLRLLQLYDQELDQTGRLLQMSSRQHASLAEDGLRSAATASKENLGDNFNIDTRVPDVCIPGVIDSPGVSPSQRSKLAGSGYGAASAPKGPVSNVDTSQPQAKLDTSGYMAASPPQGQVATSPPQGLVGMSPHSQVATSLDQTLDRGPADPFARARAEMAMDGPRDPFASFFATSPSQVKAAPSPQGKKVSASPLGKIVDPSPQGKVASASPQGNASRAEDAQTSSQGDSSVRSSLYMTPDATPRTPPGFGDTPGESGRTQRPSSAPTAPTAPTDQPRHPPGRDFSICKHTGMVIPSIPPMPPAALRIRNAELPCLTPPPYKDALQEAAPPPPPPRRRPHSAAAVNAFAAPRSSSSGGSGKGTDKELCYPPNVQSAARHGKYEEVESALMAGFVPNYADSYGNTIFHIACQNGRKRIAKLAVKYGGDINAQNMKGNTGLHFLFAYGYPDVAEYFIKKGADPLITNAVGKTAREGIK